MVQSHMRFRQRGSTVEQLICNQWVAGSIPVAGSMCDQGKRSISKRLFPLVVIWEHCAMQCGKTQSASMQSEGSIRNGRL